MSKTDCFTDRYIGHLRRSSEESEVARAERLTEIGANFRAGVEALAALKLEELPPAVNPREKLLDRVLEVLDQGYRQNDALLLVCGEEKGSFRYSLLPADTAQQIVTLLNEDREALSALGARISFERYSIVFGGRYFAPSPSPVTGEPRELPALKFERVRGKP